MTTKIGTRVTLTNAVEHYPLGIFGAGLTGTLTRIDAEGSYWVALDKHHPELNEWDNELQIPDHTRENAGQFHPETYLDADTMESLCAEYTAKLDELGLPRMSADELLHEDMTTEQRAYVSAFYHRWEAMLERTEG